MSPEAAKIFLVEDNPSTVSSTTQWLKLNRHKVVLTASTRLEVSEKIPLIQEVGVQVALVDGNLTKGDVSGSDGREVVQEIRATAPQVKIIGFGDRDVEGVDVNCNKGETPEKLVETITNI